MAQRAGFGGETEVRREGSEDREREGESEADSAAEVERVEVN